MRVKQWAALRKLFSLPQPPPPSPPYHQIKSYFIFETKRQIYRNIQTFAFKVLQESTSWASGNGAVQILFLTPNSNMLAGKFVSSEGSLAVFWEHLIFNFKTVQLRKISFWLVFIGFEIFCYKFWNKQNSDDVHWNVWTKVVHPKKMFRKKNYKYEIFNHLYFGPSFVFWRTALGSFSQCVFFSIFRPWSTMVTDIFTQPSYGLVNAPKKLHQ